MKPRLLGRLTIVLALSVAVTLQGHDVITTSITWNREISRIVYDRCVQCHRDGGRAFSLMTYAAARPWAVAIKEEVLSRRMPPWGAVKGFGEFRNDQGLTAEQLEMITSWVEGGVPEGEAKDLPPLPKLNESSERVALDKALVVNGDFTLVRPFTLDGILPEKVAGDELPQIIAELPDGSFEPLLWLYEYKPEHTHSFLFRTPIQLPAKTVIRGVPSGSRVILLPEK